MTDEDTAYCSPGCHDIDRTLERADVDPGRADVETEALGDADRGADADSESDDETVRTYLRVDGMYASTCEAFLESVARRLDGVDAVAASYVTEAVRVDHDPDRASDRDLERALSTVGYTAYLRDRALDPDGNSEAGSVAAGNGGGGRTESVSPGSTESVSPEEPKENEKERSATETGSTRRSREMHGVRKRRSDDLLELRYVVGVVFGTFVLLPYVALLYPVYLASVVDIGMLSMYEGAFETLDDALFLLIFTVLTGAVLYATGTPLLRSAYVSLRLRRVTTDLLAALVITSAFGYATLAATLGRTDVYFDVTIVVSAVVTGAAFYEVAMKRRAMDRLTDLTISQVSTARSYDHDGTTRSVSTDDLAPGDRILVRQGERVPVDGDVLEDVCTVDEAVVTGNSLPRSKRPGETVVGGSVVTGGAAVLEVTGDASGIERLAHEVWDRQSRDGGPDRLSDRIASRVLPVLLLATLAVGATRLAFGTPPTTVALLVLLTVMVTSPWALALSTRLSVATGIREALERGLVVFDGTIFERLRRIDTVVFDKTGTLTTGRMRVIEADAPDELLVAAAALERRSAHAVGTAIASAFGRAADSREHETDGTDGTGERTGEADGTGDTTFGAARVESFRTHSSGVEGVVDGSRTLVGHPDLFASRDWEVRESLERRADRIRADGRLPVFVGREGRAEGVVVVGDEPRAGWEEAIDRLTGRGIDVVVLTGDDEDRTGPFVDHPGIDRVFAGVPPAGKVEAIRRLTADRTVAMVGDGTNDAPALADADLGISLGSATALAADAADLAILEDDLEAVEEAIEVAATSRRRLAWALGLAFLYNAIAIPLALTGFLNPLFATASIALTCVAVAMVVSWPLRWPSRGHRRREHGE